MDVTAKMSLSYLLGRPAKLGFVRRRDGQRDEGRGGRRKEKKPDRTEQKEGRRYRKDKEQRVVWCRREIREEGMKLKDRKEKRRGGRGVKEAEFKKEGINEREGEGRRERERRR